MTEPTAALILAAACVAWIIVASVRYAHRTEGRNIRARADLEYARAAARLRPTCGLPIHDEAVEVSRAELAALFAALDESLGGDT